MCRTRPGPEMSASAIRSFGATMRCGAPLRPRCAVPPLPRAPVGFSKLIARESSARPGVLDAILRVGAPEGSDPLPRVAAVRLPGVEFESSNCRNFLVELEFAGERSRAGLPATAYVKLPCRSLATRVFANAL